MRKAMADSLLRRARRKEVPHRMDGAAPPEGLDDASHASRMNVAGRRSTRATIDPTGHAAAGWTAKRAAVSAAAHTGAPRRCDTRKRNVVLTECRRTFNKWKPAGVQAN